MTGKKALTIILFFLTTGTLGSCRVDLFEKLNSGGSWQVTPRSGHWIAREDTNSEISITFESDMNTAFVPVMDGDLGTGRVKDTNVEITWNGKTVTFKPIGGTPWPTGEGKTFRVQCQTRDNITVEVDCTFRVAGSLRYASKLAGPGTADGSRTNPYQSSRLRRFEPPVHPYRF